MDRPSYVYILASAPYGTLYTGVTANLIARTWQHKNELVEGFTKTCKVHHLVRYEIHSSILGSHYPRKANQTLETRVEDQLGFG